MRAALDPLWSGTERDAFPHEHIRPWRRVPEGARGMSIGTQFGHGPFAFVVARSDEATLVARIETPGYAGWHGFELAGERRGEINGTRVVHTLDARLATSKWIVWSTIVGRVHDWAVRSCLTRLEQIVSGRPLTASSGPAWSLRVLSALRSASRRSRRGRSVRGARASVR